MKTKLPIKNFLPFVTIMGLAIVSVYFAALVYDDYESVIKGVVGCALLVTVYRIYLSPEGIVKSPINSAFEFPGGFRYLSFAVVWAVILYWAIQFIIDMLLYLTRILFVK